MKKLSVFTTAIFTLLLTSPHVTAQNTFSLGGELLSPVGLSAKAEITDNTAVTGTFGFFIAENFNSATLEVNYLYFSARDAVGADLQYGELSPYVGGGLAFRFAENRDTQVALRVPFGIEFDFDQAPFEVYLDAGPYLNLTTDVTFSLDSSLGFRYQF